MEGLGEGGKWPCLHSTHIPPPRPSNLAKVLSDARKSISGKQFHEAEPTPLLWRLNDAEMAAKANGDQKAGEKDRDRHADANAVALDFFASFPILSAQAAQEQFR